MDKKAPKPAAKAIAPRWFLAQNAAPQNENFEPLMKRPLLACCLAFATSSAFAQTVCETRLGAGEERKPSLGGPHA